MPSIPNQIQRRRVLRRVVMMYTSPQTTARGNPDHHILYFECGHQQRGYRNSQRLPVGFLLSVGQEVRAKCNQCSDTAEAEGRE